MKNYGEIAANWWCKKIEEENLGYEPKNIDKFKENLSEFINNRISLNGHMTLSTRLNVDKIFKDIALESGMNAEFPEGYEMSIYFDTGVSVYNKSGLMVA